MILPDKSLGIAAILKHRASLGAFRRYHFGYMGPVATHSVRAAGIIAGAVLAWLIQPLLVPPFTARARVAIESGKWSEFTQTAGALLNASRQALQKPDDEGFRYDGFRNPGGKQDELEVFVTTRNRQSALAILNDWNARILQAWPGLTVLSAPRRDPFEDPNLLVVLVGAMIGWGAASMIIDRRRDAGFDREAQGAWPCPNTRGGRGDAFRTG